MKKYFFAVIVGLSCTGCVTLDIKPTSEGGEIKFDWSYPVFEFFKEW